MAARSTRSWVMIALAMVVIACVIFGLLALFAQDTRLAEVKVPGSNLTLVLVKDAKGMHRYNVLAGRQEVVHDVMLGSRGALAIEPQVSVLGEKVTITFRTTENGAPYVQFDRAACRILSHSNGAEPPPAIKDCKLN